jgi:hypothetical protein
MKAFGVTVVAAGISVIVAVAAYGQMQTAPSARKSETDSVVDQRGNLHVPEAYRTTYEALGSWAVAADHGEGAKELHVLLCVARDHRGISQKRTFSRRHRACERGLLGGDRADDDRDGQPCRDTQRLVRHGQSFVFGPIT